MSNVQTFTTHFYNQTFVLLPHFTIFVLFLYKALRFHINHLLKKKKIKEFLIAPTAMPSEKEICLGTMTKGVFGS